MKKNFITVISLMVIVSLSGISILEIPKIDKETTTNESVSSKEELNVKLELELDEDSAKELINEHDGEYINNWPKEWGKLNISESAKFTTIKEAVNDSYEIEDENCYEYTVTIMDANEQEIGFWKYLIGAQTSKLYAISGQADMAAYEIRDNKKVETYRNLKGESKEWHLLDDNNNVIYEKLSDSYAEINKFNNKIDNKVNMPKEENKTPTVELNTMSAKEAKDLLILNDEVYINKLKERFGDGITISDGRFSTINDIISTSWNIKNEPCYIFIISDGNNVISLYLIGINTGNVYAIPNQGGMSAYQIKNNEIVEIYKWPIGDSLEWHDDTVNSEVNIDLSKEEAKELIYAEDRNYLEETISSGFDFSIMTPVYSTIKEAISGTEEIEDEPCYIFTVVGSSSQNGEIVEYCRYIVCIDSKNVYITSNQGGTSIYQVKNNEIINKFNNNGELVDWRE